jgi:hypothetical protein
MPYWSLLMNRVNHQPDRATEATLKRLAEPLASYICALDNPKAALSWALVVLFDEVGQINDAAKDHISAVAENFLESAKAP